MSFQPPWCVSERMAKFSFHCIFHMIEWLFSPLARVRAGGQVEFSLQISYAWMTFQLPGTCQSGWPSWVFIVNFIWLNDFSARWYVSERVAKLSFHCKFHMIEWLFGSLARVRTSADGVSHGPACFGLAVFIIFCKGWREYLMIFVTFTVSVKTVRAYCFYLVFFFAHTFRLDRLRNSMALAL